MKTFCISYDLHQPDQNYSDLIEYFKSFNSCKGNDSFWMIQSKQDAATIREEIKNILSSNDSFIVINISKSGWAANNFFGSKWLKNNR